MSTPTLSLTELNHIAAEFGLEFRRSTNGRILFAQRGHLEYVPNRELADRCEELGSPWCEQLRRRSLCGRVHLFIYVESLPLTD